MSLFPTVVPHSWCYFCCAFMASFLFSHLLSFACAVFRSVLVVVCRGFFCSYISCSFQRFRELFVSLVLLVLYFCHFCLCVIDGLLLVLSLCLQFLFLVVLSSAISMFDFSCPLFFRLLVLSFVLSLCIAAVLSCSVPSFILLFFLSLGIPLVLSVHFSASSRR